MKYFYLFIYLFFFYTEVYADDHEEIHEYREHFILANKKIKQNDITADEYSKITKELKHYILAPYLEYNYIKKNIDDIKDSELIIFIKRFSGSVIADDIRNKWLKRLAERKNWERIISYYSSDNSNIKTRCYHNEALIRTGETERGFSQGKALWMTNKALPKECNGLSKALYRYNQLSKADFWQRIVLLMDNNKISTAKKIAPRLSPVDQKLFNNWIAVHNKPAKYLPRFLGKKFTKIDTEHSRKIITYGIKRLAKKKQTTAASLWKQLKRHYSFTDNEIGDTESAIYYRAARDHKADSLPALSKIPAHTRSKEANIWMARIALRTANWQKVLDAINAMDSETQKDGAWIYWKAKALEHLGDSAQAKQLLNQNAKNATFYGFLSADKIQQPYQVLDQTKPDRSEKIAKIKKILGIQRALELFAVGEDETASREWFNVIKTLDKQEKLAAAELALQNGQAFTGILTVSKTKDWNVVDLRFPLLYRQLVEQTANQRQVDPAWIYGVIRRESAFKADALSRVKAFGLMQLMPKTARNVSRSIGLKGLAQEDFAKPNINIQLGSSYLSQMLNRFNGNYPKATAAYNAGPGRIPKWTPETPLAADQWIESIPFDETRKYVSGVLAYTTIYDHKLKNGKGKRLSQRLSPILPPVKIKKVTQGASD